MQRQSDFVLPTLGLFTWQLADNSLVADEVFSGFYGMRPELLAEGVSIEELIGRIMQEDREEAARATHRAILSGAFSTVPFRVNHKGTIRTMVSFGRCLRDAAGTPTIFTGGVFETTSQFSLESPSRVLCH